MDPRSFGQRYAIEAEVTDAQRALELRKFFAPFQALSSNGADAMHESICHDGALDAFAENVLWRLDGACAMITLLDADARYVLAKSTKGGGAEDAIDRGLLGLLLKITVTVEPTAEGFLCLSINDLAADSRFEQLLDPNGSIAGYRSYCGTAITTSNGIGIGALFMFDDKPRSTDLTLTQRRMLCQTASNIMRYLETKREAAARRRGSMMGKGIAQFLELSSKLTDVDLNKYDMPPVKSRLGSLCPLNDALAQADHIAKPSSFQNHIFPQSKIDDVGSSADMLDRVRMALDQAASILRESLELACGGVLFLDTAVGHRRAGSATSYFDLDIGYSSETDVTPSSISTLSHGESPSKVRAFHDQYEPSKVLALSVSGDALFKDSMHMPSTRKLQTFINRYPKGHIWYIDDAGCCSSSEPMTDASAEPQSPMSPGVAGQGGQAGSDCSKQRAEADFLKREFDRARQIMFVPLWDAGGNRWYAGCFVWSKSAMPVFTVDTELSYISAFSNSLMTEISRLETLTANKLKSDFISSISHEFRSPLHGILVSTEFLKDSQLDFTQAELVDTIQTCGNTLLDTINHVLDYTKVNSFNKKGRRASSHSTELSQVSNVALLCEEVIHGMLAANEYLTMADSTLLPKAQTSLTDESQVHVILDFEHRDWNYRIQTGAFRRIVMNIFGNAQKFTTSGFILVQLRVREGTDGKQELVLNIMDSGRGMSGEYMEQKLYTPFAQEDSFAPGVGLGLSIVWSIVNQVRGMIHVRSEVGKGTDVEIIIPLAGCRNTHHRGDGPAGDERELKDAQEFVAVVRKIAPGKKIAFTKRSANLTTPVQPHLNLKRQCLENYFTDWFGFEVVDLDFGEAPPLVDLLIAEQARCDPASLLSHSTKSKRILFVQDSTASTVDLDQVLHMSMMETISCPIGPYRLAKTVLSLLRSHRQRPALRRTTSTGSMPTEMASPSRSPSLLRSGKGMTTRTDLGLSITPPELEDTITLASGCRSTINTPLSELSPTPRRLLRTSQPCTPPSPPVESDDTPLHILAVDDNPVNLYLLQRYLSKRPQDTVVTATNGLEAVRTVRARSRKGTSQAFDVIFMDLSMPEMDGFEATRLIRHFEKSVLHNKPSLDGEEDSCAERGASGAYIAALTGLGSKRDREEAESCGFDEFLTKPLAFGRIGEVLKGVVDRKRRTMGFTG